ncbi:hypothetical protein AB7M56_009178 [Bradyrhizobium elkanii]
MRGEHRGVGLGRGNVLGIKVTVDVDGDVDFLHDRVGAFREPAAPHLVAHDISLTNSYFSLAVSWPEAAKQHRSSGRIPGTA